MVFIYVLKLKNNKYYVGKTENPSFRLENHFNQNGSYWTKKYKPLKLYELKPNCDNYDEDKITIQYMRKYGKDNVRGGSFCQINLSKENEITLERMINGSSDKCYNCGGNHFIKNCPRKMNYQKETKKYNEEYYEETDEEEYWECEYCGKLFDTEKGCLFHENVYCKKKYKKDFCKRCGRSGHTKNDCYATTHIRGYELYY